MGKRFIVVTTLACLGIGLALLLIWWKADLDSNVDTAVEVGALPVTPSQPAEPTGSPHVQGWWGGVFSTGGR